MSDVNFASDPHAIACDMSAIPAAERPLHEQRAAQWLQAVSAVEELPDGFAFKLPADNAMLLNVAQFISNERLCCPFYTFNVRLNAPENTLWLTLTGAQGDLIKRLLREEISGQYPQMFN